jgi:hypothetical protein
MPTLPPTPPTEAPTPPPPTELEYCGCWGDPHCQMFGSNVDMLIMGACRHVLSTDKCPGNAGSGSFKVSATFKYAKPNIPRSFVKEVSFEFKLENGEKIIADFMQGPVVELRNHDTMETAFPTDTTLEIDGFEGVKFQKVDSPASWSDDTDFIYILTAPNGVKVAWNGIKQVEVGVPDSFAGSVCGICGQMDGTGNMVVGPYDSSHSNDYSGCPNKAASMAVNSITSNFQEMANSWYEGGDSDDCLSECGLIR